MSIATRDARYQRCINQSAVRNIEQHHQLLHAYIHELSIVWRAPTSQSHNVMRHAQKILAVYCDLMCDERNAPPPWHSATTHHLYTTRTPARADTCTTAQRTHPRERYRIRGCDLPDKLNPSPPWVARVRCNDNFHAISNNCHVTTPDKMHMSNSVGHAARIRLVQRSEAT